MKRKENDLNQTSMNMFHVNLQWCNTCIYLSRHVKTNKMAEFKLECRQQYDPNERSQRIVGKGRVRYLITHTTFIFVMDSLFVMSISGCWPSSWTHGHGFVGLFCQTKVFEKQEAQFPTVIMLNNYIGDLSSHQTIDALKSWVTKTSLWNTWHKSHKRPISTLQNDPLIPIDPIMNPIGLQENDPIMTQ